MAGQPGLARVIGGQSAPPDAEIDEQGLAPLDLGRDVGFGRKQHTDLRRGSMLFIDGGERLLKFLSQAGWHDRRGGRRSSSSGITPAWTTSAPAVLAWSGINEA